MQATMLSEVATVRDAGLAGAMSLMNQLDDATLSEVGLDTSRITPEIRAMLPTFVQALEDDAFRAMMPPEVQRLYETFAPVATEFEQVFTAMDTDSGASELRRPMSAGLLRLVELPGTDATLAAAVQTAAGSTAGFDTFGSAVLAWTDQVIRLLEDESQRVILDPAAVELVTSLVDSGRLNLSAATAERSRAAHLGAGFIGRLPAFPEAPFDELLDLRTELSGPLTRYRAAAVRMSKSLTTSPFEQAIRAEADDLWTAEVAPALQDLEDAMTDHGLVRELGRQANEDARQIVMSGSGLLIGLEQLGHLSATISATVTAGAVGAGIAGRAINQRNAAAAAAQRAELYYLYRLGPGRA
jgi:hypothetical protein